MPRACDSCCCQARCDHQHGALHRIPARAALFVLLTASLSAQSPAGGKTHRLEATPKTVAYGYYWSEAQPALRVASGDIIDVDTLLTNSPTGLSRAGVSDD